MKIKYVEITADAIEILNKDSIEIKLLALMQEISKNFPRLHPTYSLRYEDEIAFPSIYLSTPWGMSCDLSIVSPADPNNILFSQYNYGPSTSSAPRAIGAEKDKTKKISFDKVRVSLLKDIETGYKKWFGDR